MFQTLEIAHLKTIKEVETVRYSIWPECMMGRDRLLRNKAVQISKN